MNRNILLVGPIYMDLYKDVIEGFRQMGDDVDFIQERSRQNDPLNVRRERFCVTAGEERKKEKYWRELLSQEKYSKAYDILFVLDGQGLHSLLFDTLRKRNPDIRCVNFLFDTVKGVYKFNNFFHYFENVFTFDSEESEKYGVGWLPIYWMPQTSEMKEEYDMFGFGAFSPSRYEVYKSLDEYCQQKGLRSYIKLNARIHREWLYALRRLVRKPLGLRLEITLEQYHSSLVEQRRMSPTEFRDMINKSKIIIDTHPAHQDGLTARFMWALGARKKIITTNENVVNYVFYNPSQIHVVKMGDSTDIEGLEAFINEKVVLTEKQSADIDKYRIDQWLNIICN